MSEAPDISLGCIHPRENFAYYGNFNAELELYNAIMSNHLHHAWIIAGPKSIGKATLAYRFARFYLGAKPTGLRPLDCYENDLISQQIKQNSCPDLRIATRYCPDDEKVKSIISVHAIRDLISMFDLRANNVSGRRIAIIDSADEMNDASANALLKTLEEPPKNAVLLLLVNSIGAILPTIRSRCRVLNLKPMNKNELKAALPDIDFATQILSNGCYGRGQVLKNFDIEQNYRIISRILGMMPNSDFNDISAISKLGNDIDKFEIILEIIENWFQRAANTFYNIDIEEIEPGESANMTRIISHLGYDKIFNITQKINQARLQVANHLDKSIALSDLVYFIKSQFKK